MIPDDNVLLNNSGVNGKTISGATCLRNEAENLSGPKDFLTLSF